MSYFLILLASFALVAVIQLRFVYRRRRLLNGSWQSILTRIEPLDVAGLKAVAECYLQPDKNQLRLEPTDMWRIVGGLEGVSRLRSNAEVMLDLAVYAERWNQGEGPVVSEMIRRDAVRLKQAVTRIQITFFLQIGLLRTPFHLQEAISSYCLIRSRLIGLYENAHVGLLPSLVATV